MKTLITLIIICGLIASAGYAAQAQDYDFSVLSKSGDVQVKKKSAKNYQPVKAGDKLNDKDEIRVYRGGYIGMVHKSGKTVELTAPGTYPLAQLSKKLTGKKSSVTGRFTRYVTDELTSSNKIIGSGDYRQNMQEVGATERATEGQINYTEKVEGVTGYDKQTSSAIGLVASLVADVQSKKVNGCFPGSTFLIDNDVTFSWNSVDNAKNYSFVIADTKDSPVFTKTVNDTTATINLLNANLVKGKNYWWYVVADDKKSDEQCIHWMTDEEAGPVRDTVNLIMSEFDNSHSPMEKLTLAAYYEDVNIMNRAVSSYLDALTLAPGNKDYCGVCCRYLRRIGQYRMADIVESSGKK